ncbi:MAG: hypothetical protein H7122_13345 [Chitinophagaceae bacterium]|nr:hypothetical protein [Chitinophagaceae bacterium]
MDKDQKKDSGARNTDSNQERNAPEQPDQKKVNQHQQLTKEDLPESTNESKGTMGSGQRQDSN